MTDRPRQLIEEIFNDTKLIEAAVCRAVREAVLAQAKLGYPVATWRDGKVVWLEPAEVLASLGNEPTPSYPAQQPPGAGGGSSVGQQ